jgi:hypothetical protein
MEWQPIETAPKDGTPILIAYKLSTNGPVKTWSKRDGAAIRPARWRGGYDRNSGHYSAQWQFEVSGFVVDPSAIMGWMPLPSPPENPILSERVM